MLPDAMTMRYAIQAIKISLRSLVLGVVATASVACSSEFERCVEAKQDQYKREHPDDNWENLVRAREQFQQECRQ